VDGCDSKKLFFVLFVFANETERFRSSKLTLKNRYKKKKPRIKRSEYLLVAGCCSYGRRYTTMDYVIPVYRVVVEIYEHTLFYSLFVDSFRCLFSFLNFLCGQKSFKCQHVHMQDGLYTYFVHTYKVRTSPKNVQVIIQSFGKVDIYN
jgi:hypothetical protein